MKRKTVFILIAGIIAVVAFPLLSSLFQQEAPKNTIRILVAHPMDQRHLRLKPLLEEKKYRYLAQGDDFDLQPPDPAQPVLQFRVVADETTRALIFLKGEADVLYDVLSLAKTEWLKNQLHGKGIRIFSAPGNAVSTLALNLESPALKDADLRSAIASSLPLKLWRETVFFSWVDPVREEKISPITLFLPRPITLRYLTTPSREGQQLAFLTQEALEKIGFTVQVRIYEHSLFYSKIRKREFDLFSARSLPGMKTVLDLPNTELVPLFSWRHGLIVNSRVSAPAGIDSRLDDSFRFLADLQLH